MKVCTKILAPFVISMIPLASYGQVSTQHVGSFNWRGGITNIGQGEFLYGTLTIGSNGKIASSYFVPWWNDNNTFSGTINLKTGEGNVSVVVNGKTNGEVVKIKVSSWQKVGFNGSFTSTKGGGGIMCGYR